MRKLYLLSILLTFCLTSLTLVSSQCQDDQKVLLLQLKNNLIFDSSISRKLVQWNQTDDCCTWNGIECDGAGNVISLQLDDDGISGGIENSSTLFSLSRLEKLNLAFNYFGDIQIPKRIHNLTHLTHLNLSNAGFVGQIPAEISRMRRLVSLDLSSQFISSILPMTIVNPNLKMLLRNLTGLQELYLDGISIYSSNGSEWCEAISSSLHDLRNLSLRGCNLPGPLDSSLSRLRSLSILQLDNNNLSTTVPNFFANFSSLTTLTLSWCSLQGVFPWRIFQIPTLQTLDLSNNMLLSGTIPEFHQVRALRTIVLAYTNFSGPLPVSIVNLSMLSEIDLSNCMFTGSIPSTFADLKEIVRADLSYNFFTGPVPSFYKIKKLQYIDLNRNGLTGSVSSMRFEGNSNLVFVNLGFNSLSGSIPSSLFGLSSLEKLLLSNNKFNVVESGVANIHSSNMDTLDLSSNIVKGPIPESFFKLEMLNVLSLSHNYFNGTVQLEKIQSLRNLTRLDLSHNNLTLDASNTNSSWSRLPQLSRLELASCNLYNFPDLRNQSRLGFLDLSNNYIAGEIPSWIWEIGKGTLSNLNLSLNLLVDLQKPYNFSLMLAVLDLNLNQLRGDLPLLSPEARYVDYSNNNFGNTIPQNIGNLINPIFLSLANNILSGVVPTSLCNSTYLRVLDLSANQLSGNIPSCLVENIPNLGVLNLRRNNLSGDIPDIFSVNCGLKTLDLSKNNLGGKIPASVANCKSLEVMNIGNNNIGGSFPCMLSSSLHVLVLRSNRFRGEVRCRKSWPNLQIIDIASNNFSGYLYPESFSSWKGMTLDNDAQSRLDNLRFKFLDLNNFYYQDDVTLTIKGMELELVKILTVFTSVDLSCNNFQGEIPDEIGDLTSLYILNLSHNSLTGRIQRSIGNLMQLGSLDLSGNQLKGEIPEELTRLTFLSFLNLSYNNLVGMIPVGSQFQTFSAASYKRNTGLCGFPLNKRCNILVENDGRVPSYQKTEIEWEYVSAALGFVVGLGSIIWLLFGFRKSSEKFSELVDQVLVKIFDRKVRKRRRGGRVLRNQTITRQ